MTESSFFLRPELLPVIEATPEQTTWDLPSMRAGGDALLENPHEAVNRLEVTARGRTFIPDVDTLLGARHSTMRRMMNLQRASVRSSSLRSIASHPNFPSRSPSTTVFPPLPRSLSVLGMNVQFLFWGILREPDLPIPW